MTLPRYTENDLIEYLIRYGSTKEEANISEKEVKSAVLKLATKRKDQEIIAFLGRQLSSKEKKYGESASTNSKEKILCIGLDADGCIFNPLYISTRKAKQQHGPLELKDEVHILISCNKPFFCERFGNNRQGKTPQSDFYMRIESTILSTR